MFLSRLEKILLGDVYLSINFILGKEFLTGILYLEAYLFRHIYRFDLCLVN